MIIGITGGTGCGKTTALQVIAQLGGTVIDCDRVYHDLLETDVCLLQKIEARFPGTVEQGKLLRKKLGSQVFSDPEALRSLSDITHPAVKKRVEALLTPQPRLAAIDAIGLFEGGLSGLCDITVAVTAPENDRIARIMAREGISREYATARIAAQQSNAYFSALCEHTLENDGSEEAFRGKCLAFFRRLAIIEEKPTKENKL